MQRFGSTVKRITVDHGKDFAQYHSLEQRYWLTFLFLSSLFALGTRQQWVFQVQVVLVFLKKKNFNQVTTDLLLETIELINNRPLKLYNYRTAIDVFRTCSD